MLAAPIGLLAAIGEPIGAYIEHGGLPAAATPGLYLVHGLLVVLATVVLFVAAALTQHWLWHRDEAPHIHNELLTGAEADAVRAAWCARLRDRARRAPVGSAADAVLAAYRAEQAARAAEVDGDG